MALPTGTVTLLFTDIVGSTALLQQIGDAYRQALDEHRTVLRAAFAEHGGAEVGTQGDSFFVAFSRASDALAAACHGQDTLTDTVRVRMGMHTGEPHLAGDDYIGLDVHRAARIAAAANAGQVLLSQRTRDLVEDVDVTYLGIHRLKDVGEMRLYQAGHEEFPPVNSLNRTNLPATATRPVGRDVAIADILRMVRDDGARLITITGPGGIGKTTLGLEIAAELQPGRGQDGTWFVDLSPVADPTLVAAAVSAAVGAPGDLADHLRDRRAVLLLDNVEQVVEAAPWIAHLLEACPGVMAIVTSREALRVRAEREYPLDGLTVSAAAEVFLGRARATQPGFDAEPERVGEICRRLDGIPLAIELAAARVRVLGVDGLLRRLDSRLELLTGGARDLPERQRTLQATIAWSHDLLSEAEGDLFARLAVFAGGWTLDAAEHVCGADLDVLAALVDRSLVRTADERFSMFETIREFALARLADREDADAVHQAHARYYMALVRDAAPGLYGADQPARLEQLSTEYENLRSALTWCSAAADRTAGGLAIASDLGLYWFVRGLYQEGLRWLDPLLEATSAERTPDRAGALWSAGLLATMFGDDTAAPRRLRECVVLAREIGDESRLARSYDVLGLLAFFGDEPREARRLLEQSIAVARQANDAWCLADALGTVASIYPLLGDFAAVRSAAPESLAIARRNDDLQGVRMALFAEALAWYRLGNLAAVRRDATAGLAICREIGDRWFVSYFLWLLSLEATARGDREHACELALESLERARDLAAPLLLVCALEALAAVRWDAGDLERAEGLLDEADALGGAGGVPGSYHSTVLTMQAGLAAARGDDDRAAGLAQRAVDRAREVGDPWAIARALTARAAAGAATAATDAREALAVQSRLGDLLGAAVTLDVLAGFAEPATARRRSAAATALRLRAGAASAGREAAGEFVDTSLDDIAAGL